jgi:WhiB family transcriptional regulator, redox-sensing transcriptional regulator
MTGAMTTAGLTATWKDRAECRAQHLPPAFFFGDPTSHGTRGVPREVAAICAACPVSAECLDYALAMPELEDHGIWGGTSRAQRLRMREKRRRSPVPVGVS